MPAPLQLDNILGSKCLSRFTWMFVCCSLKLPQGTKLILVQRHRCVARCKRRVDLSFSHATRQNSRPPKGAYELSQSC
eukprot:5452891-Amphidinium_carterae.2